MRWNDMWYAILLFRLHAMRCNLDSFDLDYSLIILFLISLRIWASVLMWNWLNRMSKIRVYTCHRRQHVRPPHDDPEDPLLRLIRVEAKSIVCRRGFLTSCWVNFTSTLIPKFLIKLRVSFKRLLGSTEKIGLRD